VRRRQLVAAGFVALGGVALGLSLRIDPGSPWFYPAVLGVAAIWVVGALVTGGVRLGPPGPVALPIAAGLALAGVFVLGTIAVREAGLLSGQLHNVGDHAAEGTLAVLAMCTATTGIAEELFFRGSLYAAFPARPVLASTAAYGIATLGTGNLLLAFSAFVLGAVVGLERQRYDGLVAPILTHLSWSLTMLVALPALL
jgi:uncharacterized protein